MILSARIYTHSDRVEYDFNTKNAVHAVWFANHPPVRGSAGDVINALIPYRDNIDIVELIAWLSEF